jgi:hypothetical protein
MTWPSERVARTALWKLTEPGTDADIDARARGVRRKDTRVVVRGTQRVPKQSRRE